MCKEVLQSWTFRLMMSTKELYIGPGDFLISQFQKVQLHRRHMGVTLVRWKMFAMALNEDQGAGQLVFGL